MQESMGPVVDRDREHLCALDANIVRVRRLLADSAERLEAEKTLPPGAQDGAVYRSRPVGIILPGDGDWVEQSREQRRVPAGDVLRLKVGRESP